MPIAASVPHPPPPPHPSTQMLRQKSTLTFTNDANDPSAPRMTATHRRALSQSWLPSSRSFVDVQEHDRSSQMINPYAYAPLLPPLQPQLDDSIPSEQSNPPPLYPSLLHPQDPPYQSSSTPRFHPTNNNTGANTHPQLGLPTPSPTILKGADMIAELFRMEKQALVNNYTAELDKVIHQVKALQKEAQAKVIAQRQRDMKGWEEERSRWEEERQRLQAARNGWEEKYQLEARMSGMLRRRLEEERKKAENLQGVESECQRMGAEMRQMYGRWQEERKALQEASREWKVKYGDLHAHWKTREKYWGEYQVAVDIAGCIYSDGLLKRKRSAMSTYLQTDYKA